MESVTKDSEHECRFRLEPCSDEFFDAPKRGWYFEEVLEGSCDEVFRVLTDAELEAEWFPNFRSSAWRSEPGPGAIRDYSLSYMRIVERFVEYEPGRRLRFYVSSCSIPLLKRFCETYTLEPAPGGRTRLQWRIGYEPHFLADLFSAILVPHFESDFRKAMAALGSYLERRKRASERPAPAVPSPPSFA